MPASKEEIATKFMALAYRYGFARTTIEDVVGALHISKKTVYDHFANKEELLRYAIELGAAEQRRRVEARVTETGAVARALQVVSLAIADVRALVESNPHPEFVEPNEISEQVNGRVFSAMVRDLISEGVANGEITVPDIDFTTACCMAVGMEAVRLIREDPANRPEPAARDAIGRLLADSNWRKG